MLSEVPCVTAPPVLICRLPLIVASGSASEFVLAVLMVSPPRLPPADWPMVVLLRSMAPRPDFRVSVPLPVMSVTLTATVPPLLPLPPITWLASSVVAPVITTGLVVVAPNVPPRIPMLPVVHPAPPLPAAQLRVV